MMQWESICTQQFQMSYYGKISYEASEEMSVYERKFFYNLLVETKKEEAEARKEAMEKAKSSK